MRILQLLEDGYPMPSKSLIFLKKLNILISLTHPSYIMALSPFIIKTALLCADLIMAHCL